MLAVFVADPAQVTPEQMDRWAHDFANWADCDTACFDLFDKSPHAFAAIDRWADAEGEFVKRAAFALLASLALHDKKREDAPFLERLTLVEAAAGDPRNFVKKGVSWALRAIGRRRSPALQAAARAVAERLPPRPTAREGGSARTRSGTSMRRRHARKDVQPPAGSAAEPG